MFNVNSVFVRTSLVLQESDDYGRELPGAEAPGVYAAFL